MAVPLIESEFQSGLFEVALINLAEVSREPRVAVTFYYYYLIIFVYCIINNPLLEGWGDFQS